MIFIPGDIPSGQSRHSFVVTNAADRPLWPRLSRDLACDCFLDRGSAETVIVVRFRGAIELECARCLGRYDCPVEGEFSLVLVDASAGREVCDDDGEGVYSYQDPGVGVDVSGSFYDELMTAIPLKPLCDENCLGWKGEECGSQKGKQESGGDVDARWAPLAELKRRHNR